MNDGRPRHDQISVRVRSQGGAQHIQIVFAPTRSRLIFAGLQKFDPSEYGAQVIVSKYGPMVTVLTEKPLPDGEFEVLLEVQGEPVQQLAEAGAAPPPDILESTTPITAAEAAEAIAAVWTDFYKARAAETDPDYRFFFELDRRTTNPFRKIAEDADLHTALNAAFPLAALPGPGDPAPVLPVADDLDAVLAKLNTVLEWRRTQRLGGLDFTAPAVAKLPGGFDPADWDVVSMWFRESAMAAWNYAPGDVDSDAGRARMQDAMRRFAYGELRRADSVAGADVDQVGGEPDSALIFDFAEAGLILYEENIDPKLFDLDMLVTMLRMQALYMGRVQAGTNFTSYSAPQENVARQARFQGNYQLGNIEWEWAVRDLPHSDHGPEKAMQLDAIHTRMSEHLHRLAPSDVPQPQVP